MSIPHQWGKNYDSLVTYHTHGCNQRYPLLCDTCDVSDIIMIQEHWLAPFDSYNLDKIHSNLILLYLQHLQ